jgi:hypothetical protein
VTTCTMSGTRTVGHGSCTKSVDRLSVKPRHRPVVGRHRPTSVQCTSRARPRRSCWPSWGRDIAIRSRRSRPRGEGCGCRSTRWDAWSEATTGSPQLELGLRYHSAYHRFQEPESSRRGVWKRHSDPGLTPGDSLDMQPAARLRARRPYHRTELESLRSARAPQKLGASRRIQRNAVGSYSKGAKRWEWARGEPDMAEESPLCRHQLGVGQHPAGLGRGRLWRAGRLGERPGDRRAIGGAARPHD